MAPDKCAAPPDTGSSDSDSDNDEPRADEGPWRLRQTTAEARPTLPGDDAQIHLRREQEARNEAQRHYQELVASQTGLFSLRAVLFHPLAIALLVGSAVLLGLFLFSQIIATLSALAGLPIWIRYPGYLVLCLLAIALAWAIGRFAVFFVRLVPNRPVRLRVLDDLAQRTHLRWLVQEEKEKALNQLMDYLRGYPMQADTDRTALVRLGLTEESLSAMERAREDLLDPNRFANFADWFAAFRSHFQNHLDAAARERSAYFARRALVVTAASPNTVVDIVQVTYFGFAMLTDQCRIYNLRVNWLGTVVLLARVFLNAYLAGRLNESEEAIGTSAQKLAQYAIGESGVHVSALFADLVATKLFRRMGARLISGLLNYHMMKRLGEHAAHLLRPVYLD